MLWRRMLINITRDNFYVLLCSINQNWCGQQRVAIVSCTMFGSGSMLRVHDQPVHHNAPIRSKYLASSHWANSVKRSFTTQHILYIKRGIFRIWVCNSILGILLYMSLKPSMHLRISQAFIIIHITWQLSHRGPAWPKN